MSTVSTEGDAGDLIFCLSVIHEIPNGPHDLLIKHSNITTLRTPATICRFQKLMASLVESQPYIRSFRVHAGEPIEWDSGGFRNMGLHYSGISLLECHAMHFASTHNGHGSGIRGVRPWLTVEPSMETRGMVVINRTDRYRNQFFPWRRVVEHYRGRLLFIGLKHEYETFCHEFGKVSWRQTADMLEKFRHWSRVSDAKIDRMKIKVDFYAAQREAPAAPYALSTLTLGLLNDRCGG